MPRLIGEDFARLFVTFERAAFRLETRGVYQVDQEREAYRRFLAGEPYDLGWHQPWLDGIRRITKTGRLMQRVRLVADPPTDYQRFELAVAPTNQAAGEDIRLLDQAAAAVLDLPPYDFWLFDERRLAVMHFDNHGAFHGADTTEDPPVVAQHRLFQARALSRAVPYHDYLSTHPALAP